MQFNALTDKTPAIIVEDVDCADLTDAEADRLYRALGEHQLLIFPHQENLTPAQEVAFYKRLDPDAVTVWRDQRTNPWEVHKVKTGNRAGTYQIPGEPGVLVLGQGAIEHHGLRVVLGGKRGAYGDDDGSQVLGGGALQWHIDGAFYAADPCRFTQMRCIEAPRGPGRHLEYADGSGVSLWAPAGATCFASGRLAYQRLDAAQKRWARRVKVHYAPHPFAAVQDLPNSANGLRVVGNDAEDRPGQVFDDPAAKIYPLVWTCPISAQSAVMVHPRCLDHLEDGESGRHLGVRESRLLVEKIMRPAIEPDSVYVHPWAPGDLLIWNNHSIWHSASGGLGPEDRRVMHLTAYDGSAPMESPATH